MTDNIYLRVIVFLIFILLCLAMILMIVGIIKLIYDMIAEWFNF